MAANMDHAALTLYQEALDIMSDAILACDLEMLQTRIKLPYRSVTLNSDTIIETRDDLRAAWLEFGRSLQGLGVNQFIRLASDAEFMSADYIQGYHVTHTLRNGTRVVPSYSNRMVLQRIGEVWKLTEVDSAVKSLSWPMSSVRVPDGSVDLIGFSSAENDIRRSAAEPIAVYQRFLDALTRATFEDDFDAYCARCSFPYSTHGESDDTILRTPEDVRPFFAMLRKLLHDLQADTFERSAAQAEFLSGNQICGYHTTTMSRNGVTVLGPIQSRMVLERTGADWKLKSVTNTVANEHFPYAEPEPSEQLVTIRQIQERQRK